MQQVHDKRMNTQNVDTTTSARHSNRHLPIGPESKFYTYVRIWLSICQHRDSPIIIRARWALEERTHPPLGFITTPILTRSRSGRNVVAPLGQGSHSRRSIGANPFQKPQVSSVAAQSLTANVQRRIARAILNREYAGRHHFVSPCVP